MSVTCQSHDFGKTLLDLIACGWSSNASFNRYSVKNCAKSNLGGSSRSYASRKSVYCRRGITQCRVSSMKTPETMLNESTKGPTSVLDLKNYSRSPISLTKLFEVVADDLETLNQNLRSIVGAENPVLMSAAEQIFAAGGKRMRPALIFLVSRATAQLVGLKEITIRHRRLAEIIEMIHTASLIHDDVLDESDLRRGKETVHQLYGTRVAVLAGDFMFAQSSWYLANLENLEVIKLISQVIKDFASGEIKQASSLFDCDVELEEYLIKSYYKTASLIAASTKGAAIFSGADRSITEKMYEYGKNLGLSFQVVDDILDFTQSAEQLGKPAASDLVKGNLTAPVIFALEKEPKLRDVIESEFSETGSIDEAIELVKSSGGIERAQELAKEKADVAIQNLQCLPPSVFRLALEDMVMYNLERIA
ncbi:putative Solanesyl diphosphate synthase [Quillaja saponaria]|uniref:Solanesyl diphosphate synthase n=1 Tax=Quillaja saponaria TaxID=32244 RepID=A0AAD7KZL9_QUISA|nr:putative Solanesyl diphosphate synthase [Quillaja saponaria]